MGKTDLSNEDSFLCACGPCKSFYRQNFLVYRYLKKMSTKTHGCITAKLNVPHVRYADRVLVYGRYSGIVKYVGPLDINGGISSSIYVGVHLDDNIGSINNGMFRGKRYFHCPRGHGAIVKLKHVSIIPRPEKKPPLYGNPMFPSYKEILKTRRIRSAKDPDCRFTTPYAAEDSHRSHSRISAASSTDASNLRRPRQSPHRLKKATPESPAPSWDPFKSNSEEFSDCPSTNRTVYLPRTPRSSINDPQLNKELDKWRREFGGGDRANQLVETLRKLHLAYREGMEMTGEDERFEEESEN